MTEHDGTHAHEQLLLKYVGLLAERQAFRPEDGFEFALWEDLLSDHHALVSYAECAELKALVLHTGQWVSYDFASGRLQLIGVEDWMALLAKRAHEEEIDEGGRAHEHRVIFTIDVTDEAPMQGTWGAGGAADLWRPAPGRAGGVDGSARRRGRILERPGGRAGAQRRSPLKGSRFRVM